MRKSFYLDAQYVPRFKGSILGSLNDVQPEFARLTIEVCFGKMLKKGPDWVHWPPRWKVGNMRGKKQDHVLDT